MTFRSFSAALALTLVACAGRLDVGDDQPVVPERAATARSASVVALGTGHGCAVLEDTTVACWGFNRNGQTGVRPADSLDPQGDPYIVVPARVPGLTNVVQITAGWQSTYALRSDGKVLGWGATSWTPGEAGYDAAASGNVPREVPDVSDVVKVSDGGGPVCALRRDGSVLCWGRNTYLNAGTAKATPQSMNEVLPPTIVPGIDDAVDITVSDSMSCVRHRNGDVSCWGRVQLVADEYTPDSGIPVKIPGVHHAVEVAMAQSAAIALLEDGTVMGWGDSDDQTGILAQIHGPRDPRVTSYDSGVPPAVFPGLTGIVSVRAQYRTMCALGGDGSITCWGRNDVGELGQGRTTTPISTPTRVEGVTGVQLEVGTWNSCAIGDDRRVVCWGGGSSGALGTGKEEKYASKPNAPVLLPAPLARAHSRTP